MSDYNVLNTSVYQHLCGDLTCVCPLLFEVHVLGTNLYVGSFHSLYNWYDIDCRYTVNNIYAVRYY